ncbi:LOW QUALITY PROTEIN: mitochondrial glycine transporter-like [Oppia nitens]|uniref:LOW QUALITY PROTEIN: mitochondrial glycine transporter-like n=1 Tax=Oppia nitens TaxID=1686743 RepID=UPI0023D97DDB|nr:LOW QUALITY PROTEIN: mitochondrial glycine transporter-like [Oppia nitens]
MPSPQCCAPTDELLGFPIKHTRHDLTHLQTQKRITELLSGHPTLKSFLAGSISGTVSTVLFQPFDLVKTRIQNANLLTATTSTSSSVATNRLIPLVNQVLKEEQLLGLWRGTVPSLVKCVPGIGLYFCSLDYLKTQFCKNSNGVQCQPSAIEAVSFGLIARSFAGFVLIPVTVVKTRYESGVFAYGSLGQALRHTYVSEGARGLVCGLVPTLMRDAPFSGLYYMFYSQLKQVVVMSSSSSSSNNTCISPVLNFTIGLNAGLLASIVTHPMDVVKTRMQLYPRQFSSLMSTLMLIMHERGVKGYFSGLLPRMIRRTLVASMTWTVYEQLMKNIGLN